MAGLWERNIVEPGKLPLFLALTSFVVTFLITRSITRMIRAGKGPFRNLTPGGVHIHHVVPGVILTVIGGFGAIGGYGHGFGSGLSAVLFGIGVGLVLDEFALVLHLADVYWTQQGRQSVEAVVLTAALVGLLLLGFVPFGVNGLTDEEAQDRLTVVANMGLNFCVAVIALVKGKLRLAVIGVFIPYFALVGAVRLARPTSPWAKRFYRSRPRARARSRIRAYRHDKRWDRLSRRFQDLVAGAPSR
ncbi:hypothetical protein [Streptomyces sp. NPDC051776]|uniref:hypothetical protein n=1 Tax=Streptomyces sp. NPDC051776 TaxID=3155414 RepID=UPI003446C04A